MESKSSILLVEDDINLGFVISDNLKEAGYEVVQAPNGEVGWKHFLKRHFDLILLDIMMPEKDGITLAGQIREKNEIVPLLFLTARAMEDDRISGFKAGADDYIVKPFSMKELLLRIEVFLRRTHASAADKNKTYQLDGIRFNYPELNLTYPDQSVVGLTQKEAELLKFFCENPNKILKRSDILLHVWGKSDYFLGRSMDVFIAKIRKHFKKSAGIQLLTIHGVGFKFVMDP